MNFQTRDLISYGSHEWYVDRYWKKDLYGEKKSDFWYEKSPVEKESFIPDPYKLIFGPLDIPTHPKDPLDMFFDSKRKILSKSVDDVVGLIYEREKIKIDNLAKIDYDSCSVKTKIFAFDHWPPETNQTVERKRAAFEKELLNLEREKRMEEVNCWRDVTRLKGDLREMMGKVEEEKRRQTIINGE